MLFHDDASVVEAWAGGAPSGSSLVGVDTGAGVGAGVGVGTSLGSTPSPIPTSPITYRRTSLSVIIPNKRPFLPPCLSSSCVVLSMESVVWNLMKWK